MTTYVTEVQENREPAELQVLHKLPMEARAAQLAGQDGPRSDQTQKGLTMSTPTMTRPEAEPRTASNSPARLQELAAAERTAEHEQAQLRSEWRGAVYQREPDHDREAGD